MFTNALPATIRGSEHVTLHLCFTFSYSGPVRSQRYFFLEERAGSVKTSLAAFLSSCANRLSLRMAHALPKSRTECVCGMEFIMGLPNQGRGNVAGSHAETDQDVFY